MLIVISRVVEKFYPIPPRKEQDRIVQKIQEIEKIMSTIIADL